jgi:hypothetical protein
MKALILAFLMCAASPALAQNSGEMKADAMEAAADAVRDSAISAQKAFAEIVKYENAVKAKYLKAKAAKGVDATIMAKLVASQQSFWAYYRSQVASMAAYSDVDSHKIKIDLLADRRRHLDSWLESQDFGSAPASRKLSDMPGHR